MHSYLFYREINGHNSDIVVKRGDYPEDYMQLMMPD
jgi:hypothetical protein